MANVSQSAGSLRYVSVGVKAVKAGVAYNPTGDTVTMAFTTSSEDAPLVTDWKTSSWETVTTTVPATYNAICLIGPGGAATFTYDPTREPYAIWLKIGDSPEVPADFTGNSLTITP